jgi:hypothetical protein
MNYRPILAFLALVLVLTSAARGQQSHLQVRYAKEIDVTIVDSDLLYVINMPAQFMVMRLEGSYPKQGKPTQLPGRITIQFSSYAEKPLYQSDDLHKLRVKADDQILDFGLLGYSKFEEQSKDGDKKTNSGVRAALPSPALVGANSKSNGLTLESMSVLHVTLVDLVMLARAGSVIMKIGDTVFTLTPTQLTILREFVEAITPTNADSLIAAKAAEPAKVSEPAVPADVPSEVNHAPLDQTLKWIKTEIERESSTYNLGVPLKLEPLDFNSCRIRYRVVPLRRETTTSNTLVYAILEYRMDLGELNPERVLAAGVRDNGTLVLFARDQSKIRVIKHANESGTMGRTLDETEARSFLFALKSGAAAARLKVALVHAINLCHAQR